MENNKKEFETIELYLLFEHVEKTLFKDLDTDVVFKSRKAQKSYNRFDRLCKDANDKIGYNKWQNGRKNFGSAAFYQKNPILFISNSFESYIHLKNAYTSLVISTDFTRKQLLKYLDNGK